MGTVPKAETERDEKLIADYLKGEQLEGDDFITWEYSISELGLKYAREVDGKQIPLTATRIHQILNKHGVDKKRVPANMKKTA